MKESTLGKELMKAWTAAGHRLFRFNTGMGWIGKSYTMTETKTVTLPRGAVVIIEPRPLHAGFTGASDYWGFKRVTITPEMVGQTIAQFAVMETKSTSGRLSKEQRAFLEMVSSMGGVAKMVKSVEESFK